VFRNVGIKNSDAGELPRRKHTRNMCIHHVLLTDSSKIKKYGIRIVSSALMFTATFVKIGSAVETRAMAHTKPTW